LPARGATVGSPNVLRELEGAGVEDAAVGEHGDVGGAVPELQVRVRHDLEPAHDPRVALAALLPLPHLREPARLASHEQLHPQVALDEDVERVEQRVQPAVGADPAEAEQGDVVRQDAEPPRATSREITSGYTPT
jgi:hypothetical protein